MTHALITGVGGFVGSALASTLLERGYTVSGIARQEYPMLAARGVRLLRCDVADLDSNYYRFFDGVDVVFHVAAKVGMWGRWEEFYRANVIGTQNLLAACRHSGVRAFVHTSSPSVVADGTNLRGINESYPYPKRYHAHYPHTKALAEQSVLSAHSSSLATLALRPHLIWGPGDTNLIPMILKRARAGRLIQVGDGENVVDLSYIDDCVQAHCKAGERLLESPREVGGRTYFVSQGEPVKLWNWVAEVVFRSGCPPLKRKIGQGVAELLGTIAEGICSVLPGLPEPLITRFLANEMATDHYFDISSAKELLGYSPTITIAEGLNRTFPGLARAI